MDRNSVDDARRLVHAARAAIGSRYAQYEQSPTAEITEEFLEVIVEPVQFRCDSSLPWSLLIASTAHSL